MARKKTSLNDGFTLIELVVSTALVIIVLSVVGGLMISSINTSNTVRSVTDATTAGQLVTNSLDRGVRNSQIMAVGTPASAVPFSITTSAGGTDQLLIARVTGSGATSTSSCGAWYYSAAVKTVRYKSFSTALTAADKPTSEPTSWTLLASGVKPVSGNAIFSQNGQRLVISFKVEAGNHTPVVFQTSSSSQTGITGSATCF